MLPALFGLNWPSLSRASADFFLCLTYQFQETNISSFRDEKLSCYPKKDRQETFWSLICYSLHSRSLTFLLLFPDYANSRCQSYDIDTNSRSGRKRLEKDSIVNFFEKICLRGGKYQSLTLFNHNQIVQKSKFAKGKGRFAKCQCQFRHGLFCDKKCRNNK